MARKVLPSTIKIGPYAFKVLSHDEAWFDEHRLYGRMSSTELTVEVCTHFSPATILDTFLHELLHAVYFVYGIDSKDNEERTIGTLSTGISQVVIDNPSVLKSISALSNAARSEV